MLPNNRPRAAPARFCRGCPHRQAGRTHAPDPDSSRQRSPSSSSLGRARATRPCHGKLCSSSTARVRRLPACSPDSLRYSPLRVPVAANVPLPEHDSPSQLFLLVRQDKKYLENLIGDIFFSPGAPPSLTLDYALFEKNQDQSQHTAHLLPPPSRSRSTRNWRTLPSHGVELDLKTTLSKVVFKSGLSKVCS